MSYPIVLGNVIVLDHNRNNHYDSDRDSVTDLKGRPLSAQEQAKKLKSVLQSLGAPDWKGLALKDASKYLDLFARAAASADQGKTLETLDMLTAAQSIAFKQEPIQFDSKRANQIRQQALAKGISKAWKLAEQSAQNAAPIFEVRDHLKKITRYTELWNRYLKNKRTVSEPRTQRILKTAYLKRLPHLLASARKASKEGDFYKTYGIVTVLQERTQEAQSQFRIRFQVSPKDLKKILIPPFKKSWPTIDQRLEKLAYAGQAIRVRRELTKLWNWVELARVNWQVQIPLNEYRIEDLLKTAILNGIYDNYELAWTYATRGKGRDGERTKSMLDLAQQYVLEYNARWPSHYPIYFDQNLADQLTDCVEKKAPCPPKP